MKTIKIIDLLNKIANGEEVPLKIHYGFDDYKLISYGYKTKIYQCLNKPYNVFSVKTDCLNDEVEIIEDKKIEKLKRDMLYTTSNDEEYKELLKIFNNKYNTCVDKINEIIDYLESKEIGE